MSTGIRSVTSRENPVYKELRQLATSSQARRKAGRTLLDGVHLCQAWLRQRGAPPLCVVGESAQVHPEVAEILRLAAAGPADCVVLPDAMFRSISQVEHGIDVLFAVDTPRNEPSEGLVGSAVLLDNLQDPGNFGSILRSAAAAGIAEVYCSPGTTYSWAPKVLRAGMGAHFQLRIHEQVDLESLVRATRVPVLATSSHAIKTLYETDLSKPVAWLFGHEGQGVSDGLQALATHQIAIPHRGDIESLNVAASAAVCFFEQLRQQMNG